MADTDRARAPPISPRSSPRAATATACRARSITTDALYAAELRAIWHGGWLFAGFAFEIPNPGDFLTLDGRRDAGARDARRRRRRARVPQRLPPSRHAALPQDAGHVRAIVCPYHSWTYSRQGELVACHGMHDGVDKSAARACGRCTPKSCAASSTSRSRETPPAFDAFRDAFDAAGAPQGFDRARIAQVDRLRRRRELEARLGEQPRVLPLHAAPSAVREVELRRLRGGARVGGGPRRRSPRRSRAPKRNGRCRAIGVAHPTGGLATFPDPDHDLWYTCNRTALAEGFETESMDGKRVAPLMGDYRDADVGVLRMRSLPNFWLHASCDHAVVTRLLPAGPRKTRMRSYWLVRPRRARRRRLPARPAAAVLAPHQRAGLGDLQVAAEGRRLDRLRARPAVAAQGIQRRRVHPLVPEGDARRRRL